MARKPYTKQISTWWLALDTEADSQKPCLSKVQKTKLEPNNEDSEKKSNNNDFDYKKKSDALQRVSTSFENCENVKKAIKKFYDYINSCHSDDCSNCGKKNNINDYNLILKIKHVQVKARKKYKTRDKSRNA